MIVVVPTTTALAAVVIVQDEPSVQVVLLTDTESLARAVTGSPVVNAAAKFVPDGVVRKVAIPVPRLATPVAMGNPVALVRTPDIGVPSAGAVSIADGIVNPLPSVPDR